MIIIIQDEWEIQYMRHEFKNCLRMLRDTNNFRFVGLSTKMALKQILHKRDFFLIESSFIIHLPLYIVADGPPYEFMLYCVTDSHDSWGVVKGEENCHGCCVFHVAVYHGWAPGP